MMEPHCEHCPARPYGLRCRGRDDWFLGYAVPHYCELATSGNPAWTAELIRQAHADSQQEPPPRPASRAELMARSDGQANEPTPPPVPYVLSAAEQEVRDVLGQLTDSQRTAIETCASRKEISCPTNCRGVAHVCGMGYWDGGTVGPLQCGKCILEDRPRTPSEGEHAKPGLLARAANFVSAVASHVRDGAREVSDETLTARRSQCNACEFHRPSDDTCAKCGCYLAIKLKWASSECPVGKWGPEPAPGRGDQREGRRRARENAG